MKQLFILISTCLVLCISCTPDMPETEYLKAEVAGTKDISCAMPVLSFAEDSAHIRRITGKSQVLYGVTQLPDSFRVEGKKLYVRVVSLPAEEEFICNTLGVAYPHLKVLAAKDR